MPNMVSLIRLLWLRKFSVDFRYLFVAGVLEDRLQAEVYCSGTRQSHPPPPVPLINQPFSVSSAGAREVMQKGEGLNMSSSLYLGR